MVRGDDFSRASQIYLHLCYSNSHTTRTRLRLDIFAMTRLSRTQRGKLIYSHKQILPLKRTHFRFDTPTGIMYVYICSIPNSPTFCFQKLRLDRTTLEIQAMQSILKQQFQIIIQLICIHVYIVNIYIQYVFEVTSQ